MSMKPDPSLHNLEQAEIFTLGRFIIRRGSRLLSEDSARSKKVWELFKYLIANRGKTLSPEEVLENLWPRQRYADPNLAMRSLVYRLRHLLREGGIDPDLASNIVFSHGCYKWEPVADCRLDIDHFEKLCREADLLNREDSEEAIRKYQAAIYLYKGEFLPECSHHEWSAPLRSYYHHLYLQAVIKLLGLLQQAQRFPEMITVCEAALMTEYFTEAVHLHYLEALLAEGKHRKARTHYEAVTDAFYREMGAKPSAEMREIYRSIKSEDSDYFNLDISFIQEQLIFRQEAKGAFLCDPEMFCHIFNLERQKLDRSSSEPFLGLLAVSFPDFRKPPGENLKEAMADLQDVLQTNLRKGDVITRWNDAQYLVLLAGLNKEQAEKVVERIERKFKGKNQCINIVLHKKIQVFVPPSRNSFYTR